MKGNVFALSPHRINTGGQNWANLLIQWLSFLRTSYLSFIPKFHTQITRIKSKNFKTQTNTTLPPCIQCTIQAPPIALIAPTPKPFQCPPTCWLSVARAITHVPLLPSHMYHHCVPSYVCHRCHRTRRTCAITAIAVLCNLEQLTHSSILCKICN